MILGGELSNFIKYKWFNVSEVRERSYDCGHCRAHVGPSVGYRTENAVNGQHGLILICPKCSMPTTFTLASGQVPQPIYGAPIVGITDPDIQSLYDEACKSYGAQAYSGAVMIARKVLMNLAVQQGAEPNLKFVEYVEFLSNKGWVPPNGKEWVDQIRKKGNEANHELQVMTKSDADQVLRFLAMLLKFMFEMAIPKS